MFGNHGQCGNVRERKEKLWFRDLVFENSSANSVDFTFDQYIYVRVNCNRPLLTSLNAKQKRVYFGQNNENTRRMANTCFNRTS